MNCVYSKAMSANLVIEPNILLMIFYAGKLTPSDNLQCVAYGSDRRSCCIYLFSWVSSSDTSWVTSFSTVVEDLKFVYIL